MEKSFILFFVVIMTTHFVEAQVGIGTESPDLSSILDVDTTEKGILLPRMTTVQRNAVTDPANGLTVFDTSEQAYYFYNASESTWERLSSSRLERDNYVLVKTQEDFPTASAGTITLDENTFYEINGAITLDTPIDINGAYLVGMDASEDKLSKASGNVFEGSGGSIKNLTITGGGTVFSIASGSSFLMQNTIIANMSSVGTISGVGFLFSNNVQYHNNTTGIVYTNISNLLLNNQAWQDSNSGTFEKLEGNFDLFQKASGVSIANGSAIAIDISTNPTVGEGVITGTVFSGTSASKINKYTTTPANTNFTKNWFVQAPGIADEYDGVATGDIYIAGDLTSGYIQTISDNSAFKLEGTNTTSSNLLRFNGDTDNQLTYEGKSQRTFSLNASLSVRGRTDQGIFYTFFVRKIGPTSSDTLEETNSIFFVDNTTNIGSISITGKVDLEPGQSVELWGQRLTGSGTSEISIFSQNLIID